MIPKLDIDIVFSVEIISRGKLIMTVQTTNDVSINKNTVQTF